MKRQFNKPPLTLQEQIELLQSRGIRISNKTTAAHYLQYIGYYRLSGYAYYYKNKEDDKYQAGTTFEDILEQYIFDRKLRILLFDAIERIEVALKSIITSVMTEHYGAFWFNERGIFITNKGTTFINGYEKTLEIIRKATLDKENKDTFLKHYYDTYSSPKLPPSWVVMETLSIGAVSKILSLLKVEERKAIAALFKIKERFLVSWMRSLTYTRNLCAHHERVWNRKFTVKAEADKRFAACREETFAYGKVYSQAVITEILLKIIAPDNHWEKHLQELFSTSPHTYPHDMGFPKKWSGFKIQL